LEFSSTELIVDYMEDNETFFRCSLNTIVSGYAEAMSDIVVGISVVGSGSGFVNDMEINRCGTNESGYWTGNIDEAWI